MSESVEMRIERIYSSVRCAIDKDFEKFKPKVVSTKTIHGFYQDFRGGMSDADLSNAAGIILHNIASLEDHLRKWSNRLLKNPIHVHFLIRLRKLSLREITSGFSRNWLFQQPAKANGKDESVISDAFKSKNLSIIKDLCNNDKHGYPPRNGYSGKKPRLESIERVARLTTPPGGGSTTMFMQGGQFKVSGNPPVVVITGNVVDGEGRRLGDLHDLIVASLTELELILNQLGVTGEKNG